MLTKISPFLERLFIWACPRQDGGGGDNHGKEVLNASGPSISFLCSLGLHHSENIAEC